MACCLPAQEGAEVPYIIDVEKVITDYVWECFKLTRPPWQQVCIRRKDFIIEVPMNYFHFDILREELSPRPKSEAACVHPQQACMTSGTYPSNKGMIKAQMYTNAKGIVISTDFTNNTDKDQTYKFRFEKSRKASLTVTFQRGYTIGGKANFSIGLPKELPASASSGGEFDMRISVSKTSGETIEETLTWEATSEIHVAKKSSCSARVLLTEVPVSYSFKLWTKMSMPMGSAPATIRRRNSSGFRYTHLIENLQPVFEKYHRHVDFVEELTARSVRSFSVILKTSGIIEGVRLSDQKILLDSKDLVQRPSFIADGPLLSRSFDTDRMYSLPDSFSSSDGNHGEGISGGPSVKMIRAGTERLCLSPASGHQSPNFPVVEEVSEAEEGMRPAPLPHVHPHPLHRSDAAGGRLPRITTTTPGSQTSSPLSDTGSPDMSETSRKSGTITTV